MNAIEMDHWTQQWQPGITAAQQAIPGVDPYQANISSSSSSQANSGLHVVAAPTFEASAARDVVNYVQELVTNEGLAESALRGARTGVEVCARALQVLQSHVATAEAFDAVRATKRLKFQKSPAPGSCYVTSDVPKRHRCQYCDYSSDNVTHVTLHERRHTGEKPFVCEECGVAFTDNGNLTGHMRTHNKGADKPFKCDADACQFSAWSASSLKEHARKHTGEKPYPCPEPGCTYACSLKGNMLPHTASVHSDARNHACAFCPLAFKLKQSREYHHKKYHSSCFEVILSATGAPHGLVLAADPGGGLALVAKSAVAGGGLAWAANGSGAVRVAALEPTGAASGAVAVGDRLVAVEGAMVATLGGTAADVLAAIAAGPAEGVRLGFWRQTAEEEAAISAAAAEALVKAAAAMVAAAEGVTEGVTEVKAVAAAEELAAERTAAKAVRKAVAKKIARGKVKAAAEAAAKEAAEAAEAAAAAARLTTNKYGRKVRDVVSVMPCDMHKGSDAYKAYKEAEASKKLEAPAPE